MKVQALAQCHTLIIEDECLIALDLAVLVEMAGSTSVAFAATEDEAIESARRYPPDIIVSDVSLFEGSGPSAVRSITMAQGNVPVIFITASPHACEDFGEACAVLQKPVNSAQVIAQFTSFVADRTSLHCH